MRVSNEFRQTMGELSDGIPVTFRLLSGKEIGPFKVLRDARMVDYMKRLRGCFSVGSHVELSLSHGEKHWDQVRNSFYEMMYTTFFTQAH